MRYAAIYIGLLGAGIVAMSAVAQPAQAPSPVTRTVVAATKLPSVVETPLYFSALQVGIPSRETSTLSGANGILYQVSGATEASVDSEAKMLRAGDGLFLAAGKTAYGKYCKFCHGEDAKGNGALAPKDTHPPDLTDAKWDHGSTDGEIFYVIKNGVPPDLNMEPWGDRIKDTDIWNVVNYIRSLAKTR